MPKVTKSVKGDSRPSPVKGEKKPRKPAVIKSTNTTLPVAKVDQSVIDGLEDLTKFKDNSRSADVEFHGVFVRQNQFGAMEFNITEEEYADMMKVFSNDLELESDAKCLKADDYSGHFQVSGKLSKAYKDQFESEKDIPVPAKMTKVNVEGQLKVTKFKGKECGYLQINNWSALA